MRIAASTALVLLLPLLAFAEPQVRRWSHAEEFSRWGPEHTEYIVGLGALQKVRGRWRHKSSEAVSGDLERITWQVDEGFTAEQGFEWLQKQVPDGAELVFSCSGRACGSSSQWASQVFEERVLYGHDERQQYAVWRVVADDGIWTLVFYASDRANRRHFLRLDKLHHDESGPANGSGS